MELMTHAGLTPLEVLRSATVNGARAFGREDDLGVVAPGRLADLVILDGNPVASVRNLSTAWRVMKDGRLYDPYELMRSIGAR
jgi:imidazolonepropionase-like amidohydrolase